jgi:hypothetical protein
MNTTLLCVALLVPGYGEKDILKGIEQAGGAVFRFDNGNVEVLLAPTASDTDLVDLCELRRMYGLALRGTKVTDKGLRTVSGMAGLSYLDLNSTSVTDEGLRNLESLTNLGFLFLNDCPNITDEGVARLQKALPKCKIRR